MTDPNDQRHNSGSSNNQTYHIGTADVVAPNASTVVNNHTVIIRISFTVQISGESLERMFHALKEKFGTAWKKLHETRFDGESSSEVAVYRFDGSPSKQLQALQYIREKLGENAVTSVRYTSKRLHFERGQLTLSQAIDIAKDENRL